MSSPYDKVIVALDHTQPEKAMALVEEIEDKIKWFKVGPVLFSKSGHEIISFLHQKKKNIFLDLKLHDIPNVIGKTVNQLGDLGVKFLTVHCMGGRKMLEEAAHACRESDIKLLGVTLLTSHEQHDSTELGWKDSEEKIVDRLLNIAVESRLAGIICSPHEIRMAREKTIKGFLLVTPGIRPKNQEVYQDDQKRYATPADALEWGADYIVVGRPITGAREPREVVENLFI